MPKRRGRRGNGGLTRRPNGRWQAAWSQTEGGKRIRETRTFRSRNEAEWWLREAKRGHVPDDPLLSDYLTSWLAGKRSLRPSTRALYASHLRTHVLPTLGGFRLSELRPRHVESFVASLRLSPGTVGLVLRTLRGALEHAVRTGDLTDNPATHVEAPPANRKPVTPMTEEIADRILDAVEGDWIELVTRFLMGTGCRVGEACALNQEDVHDGFVSLRAPKTVPRAVSVSEDGMEALREAIRQAPRRGPKEPVFYGPKGDRILRAAITHRLPVVLERAGLEPITPHKLRHGAATRMLASGHSIKTIADQLGNTERVTAETYAHVTRDLRDAAVASLNVKRRAQ